ncbi:hypothetical protein SAMN04488515_1390 [Cognatiyoonia koreensis]|uniref:Phosphoadenosine phosphosulfate reductase n=1 Tax=Cognatiyoonia koreensis TaxID=364200 RepID=A0A1I0PS31_9RHOB|nr:hypothetical protein [Cognatiyoonia koreensis]SEW17192.1 hypothetical protein SAMN04488515_1390 [Cognatiyoonia koreensis]
MTDHALSFETDLTKLDVATWEERIDDIAEEYGYFEPLGDDHMVAFLDAGPKLLVTFETYETISKLNPDAEPRGFRFAREDGWSVLCLVAKQESWFRHPAVYGYFDRLVDDGFFEDFDNVVFHGAHSCGYAAATYSVAAPGATVLALRPQATLDPRIAGFDPRYRSERRTDFTSRYGYAPDMIDGSNHTFIAFDPAQRHDAIHAALFTRKNVTQLRCHSLSWRIDAAFDAMGIHDQLIRDAMNGTLTAKAFAKAMRARWNQKTVVRTLFQRAFQTGHKQLAANVCAFVLRQSDDPYFAEKLKELSSQGITPSRPLTPEAAE